MALSRGSKLNVTRTGQREAAPSHFADEILDRYVRGDVHEPDQSTIEEHLLFCGACAGRAEELRAASKIMQMAAEELSGKPKENSESEQHRLADVTNSRDVRPFTVIPGGRKP